MNRTLTSLLAAAAVVGATGGTVAAVSLGGPARDRDPSALDAGSSSADATTPDAADPVFWTNGRVLRDGDREVRYDLPAPPTSLARASDAWVVTTFVDPTVSDVHVVRPDGSVTYLAGVNGEGDVSPDGTRYVGVDDLTQRPTVWDLATGEEVEVISGATPDQESVGGAQFVDDDTVAAGWRPARGPDVVLSGDLGSDERTVVSDDWAGAWSISPDGRWFAAIARTGADAETGFELCALLAPTDRSDEGVTDCGSTFFGLPVFAPDSSAVLAYDTAADPRLLPTGGGGPSDLVTPATTVDVALLDRDRVLVLSSADAAGDGTVVSVCDVAGECDDVDTFGDAAQTAVLGSRS